MEISPENLCVDNGRVTSTHWFIVFLFMVLLMCMSPSLLSPVVIHTSYKDDKNLIFTNYTKKA